jgi:hypothetical protein
MEALILLATLGGPMMFARIGVMRTLNRNAKRTFYLTRKDKRTNQNQRALMQSWQRSSAARV